MKDDKTGLIDMLKQLKKELPVEKPYSPEEIPPNIEIPSDNILRKTPQHFIKNDFGDKSLHKSSNMASQEAIDWANKTRYTNAKLNEKKKLRENIRLASNLKGAEKAKVLDEINNSKKIIEEANNYLKPSNKIKNNVVKFVKKSNIPIAASIAALVAGLSGDANAASALPILGEADSLGPEQGSEDWEIENPQDNPELRRKALEAILKK